MKIDNKDFWEKDNIISTQDVTKNAADFELFMFEKAQKRYGIYDKVKSVKIFGCGTGREVLAVSEFFSPSRILASDISENMISKCKENLKLWNIEGITETLVGNAKDFNEVSNTFDLVTILNSMLTYVPLKEDRMTIFKNSLQILKPKATLVGTVHNQIGTPAKTYYFKLKNLFSFMLGDKVGNRDTGFKGFKVPGYYFNNKGLINDLKSAGFIDVEVYSLEEYYASKGKKYNRKTGYNNLFFIATKP